MTFTLTVPWSVFIHANITHSSLSVPPSVRLFIHPFIHSFIHSFIYIYSLPNSFIHSSITFIYSLTHSFTHSSITFVCLFIRSFIRSFVRSQCHSQRKEKLFLPSIAGYFSPSTDLMILLSATPGTHSLAASLVPSRIGIQAKGILFTVYSIIENCYL